MSDYTERLTTAGKRHASDKARLARSRDDLADLVQLAVRNGMSEVEAARHAGVTRMTVRAWLGKDKRM
jgi:transposase